MRRRTACSALILPGIGRPLRQAQVVGRKARIGFHRSAGGQVCSVPPSSRFARACAARLDRPPEHRPRNALGRGQEWAPEAADGRAARSWASTRWSRLPGAARPRGSDPNASHRRRRRRQPRPHGARRDPGPARRQRDGHQWLCRRVIVRRLQLVRSSFRACAGSASCSIPTQLRDRARPFFPVGSASSVRDPLVRSTRADEFDGAFAAMSRDGMVAVVSRSRTPIPIGSVSTSCAWSSGCRRIWGGGLA